MRVRVARAREWTKTWDLMQTAAQMQIPAALRVGSHVRVVAPSGPFDRTLVLRGMGWLATRYRVTFDPSMFLRTGFLAGPDDRRRAEMRSALLDPTVDAIVAARGGHGLLRIAHTLPWEVLRANPKWLVGFSDPTVFLAEAWAVGIGSVHGANVAGLGRGDAVAREVWLSALEQPQLSYTLRGRAGASGSATGTLVGGNLTVLTMLAAAGRLRIPDGCVLALEDVTETSYRVDRMLTALQVGGYLERVAAIAFGEFTDCGAGLSGVTTNSVLAERIPAGIPVAYDLPFGHGRNNQPLVLGRTVTLDGGAGVLRFV